MEEQGVPQRVIDRAKARLDVVESGCWEWTGALSKGYGRIGWRENGGAHFASVHRIVYTDSVGPIPEDLELDHLCRNRKCSNPEHLEPVSKHENLLRGASFYADNARKTQCPQGHQYTEENTYTDKLNRRFCRLCVRLRNREYYHRNKERRSQYNREWRQRNIGNE